VTRAGRNMIRLLIEATLVLALTALGAMPAISQPFQPIRKLTTWYTDRSLVDIEIVGSTSLLSDSHRLEPGRVLRLRLERAYIQTLLAERGPGFEIVSIAFDMESGLADSLIVAASPGRFSEHIPGVPVVSQSERMRRTIVLSIQSDHSAATLQDASEVIAKCRGAPIADLLWTYEWQGRTDCSRSSFPNGVRYVAAYRDDLMIQIECQGSAFPSIDCGLLLPFEGFGVKVMFHPEHLQEWRVVMEHATAFLKSKQYP
jgi:hypothetical protein